MITKDTFDLQSNASTIGVTIQEYRAFRCKRQKNEKNSAERIDLEMLTRKIVGSIEREIGEISRARRKETVSSSARYLSHLEFNVTRWKKGKIVIGGSDGSEARGKRMGFNIAGSTEPDGDSYNGGARGLAKPYRLWVRDSTE